MVKSLFIIRTEASGIVTPNTQALQRIIALQ